MNLKYTAPSLVEEVAKAIRHADDGCLTGSSKDILEMSRLMSHAAIAVVLRRMEESAASFADGDTVPIWLAAFRKENGLG